MADLSALKKRKNLGAPPTPDEATESLSAPEVAPASPSPKETSDLTTKPYQRRDGRSARKTNRTLPFATRVSPEFDESIRDIADERGLKLVELLEEMLVAYKEKHKIK